MSIIVPSLGILKPPVASGGGGVIAFDAASSGFTNTDGATSLTISHTVAPGSNRLLDLGFFLASFFNGFAVSGITYNGVALSQAAAANYASFFFYEKWYLIAPATGTHDLVITFNQALSTDSYEFITAIITSLTGVAQSSPVDATNSANDVTGSSSTPSVNVTTVSDNAMVVDFMSCADDGSCTAGGGQTTRAEIALGGSVGVRCQVSTELKTPAGSVTMDWTIPSDQNWWTIAAAYKPA